MSADQLQWFTQLSLYTAVGASVVGTIMSWFILARIIIHNCCGGAPRSRHSYCRCDSNSSRRN